MPLPVVSAMGFVVLTGLAWLCSGNRRAIAWRTVLWGLGLQLVIGLLVFRLPGSRQLFLGLNAAVWALLDSSKSGTRFLLGPLLDDGQASGGQQVIKSLILLIGLMMDERSEGGFVFIDEPFAHMDVLNIDRVAQFLEATRAQYIITSLNTHNINIYRPASLSIVTHKKRAGEHFAAIPTHLRRQR